ncbi:hypothetical protein ACOSQ3_004110 [Xanthoceras sorbifolium]
MVKQCNPRSIAYIHMQNPEPTFQRMMITNFLKYPNDKLMEFMSDRQKGVLKAITTQWPSAKTRLKYSGQKLKSLFWKASRSCTVYDFNRTMDAIKSTNKDARIWLDKIDPAYWSKHAFDNSVKCDHVTNNMTESFNSMLGEHRAKTYLCLLEHIRRIVIKRFQERK